MTPAWRGQHERGVTAKQHSIHDAAKIVVLGGPTEICGINHYTCLAVEDGHCYMQSRGGRDLQVEAGQTYSIPGWFLSDYRNELVWTELGIKAAQANIKRGLSLHERFGDVIQKWCPNCEIDEMIFYSEDYICAWCREMIEE